MTVRFFSNKKWDIFDLKSKQMREIGLSLAVLYKYNNHIHIYIDNKRRTTSPELFLPIFVRVGVLV